MDDVKSRFLLPTTDLLMDSHPQAMPVTSPHGLRERKKEAIRKKILDVSRAMFRERGFAGISMDEIALGADISRMSLFNYMTSKEAIIIALIEELILDNLADWTEPDTPRHHDLRDVIAPNIASRLDTMIANRWLLELAAEYTHYFNPGRKTFMHPVLAANFASRTKRIAAIQKEGRLRRDLSAETVSWSYEALRDVFMQRWLSDPNSTAADLHTAFNDISRILIGGLANPSTEPKPKRGNRSASDRVRLATRRVTRREPPAAQAKDD